METLILTATVYPGPGLSHKLNDPLERLVHYVTSLLLWSQNGPFNSVTICENTGHGYLFDPLTDIFASYGKRLEILTFIGNENSHVYGKGYGEGLILEYALKNSTHIAESNFFWKCTGRLYVKNAAHIVDIHHAIPNVMNTGDTRFFKVEKSFFKEHFLNAYLNVNAGKGVSIEVVYSRIIKSNKEIAPFKVSVAYLGQGASTGKWEEHFPDPIFKEARRIVHSIIPKM